MSASDADDATTHSDVSNTDGSIADEGGAQTLPGILASLTLGALRHEAPPADVMNALDRRLGTRALQPKMLPRVARLVVLNALRGGPPKDRRVLQDTLLRGASRLGDQRSIFCDAVAEALEATESSWTDSARRRQALALGRDLVLGFRQVLSSADGAPSWLQGVIRVQARVLEISLREPLPVQGQGRPRDVRIAEATMACRGDVEQAYLSWLEAQAPSTAALALLGAVAPAYAGAAEGPRSEAWGRLRTLLSRLYVDLAWTAQLREPWQLDVFAPLLQNMDAALWATLLPAIQTGLKKFPGPTATALRHLYNGVPEALREGMDTSSLTSDAVIGPILRQLKSSTNELREAAGDTLEILLTLAPMAARVPIGHTLCDALAGRDGPLAQWHQRHGVADGIVAVLHAMGLPERQGGDEAGASGAEVGDRCVGVLLDAYAKEAHDGTLARLELALGLALGLAGNLEAAGAAFAPVLQEGDKALGALRALADGVTRLERRGVNAGAMAPLMQEVESALEWWISQAQQRSGAHKGGALALFVSSVAQPSDSARQALLRDPDAFVYSPPLQGTRGRASLWLPNAQGSDSLVALCRSIGRSLGAPKALSAMKKASEGLTALLELPEAHPALVLLLSCATARDAKLREVAREGISQLHEAHSLATMAPACLAAAAQLLHETAEYFTGPAYAAEADAADPENGPSRLPAIIPQHFQGMLDAAIPLDKKGPADPAYLQVRATQFPSLLVLGTHPVVTGQPLTSPRPGLRRPRVDPAYFRQLVTRCFPHDGMDEARQHLKSSGVGDRCAQALLALLVDRGETEVENATGAVAALNVGVTALDTPPLEGLLESLSADILWGRLGPLVMEELDRSPVLGFTDAELFAFLHPAEAEAKAAEAKHAAAAKMPATAKAAAKPKPAARKAKKSKGTGAKRKRSAAQGLEDIPGLGTPALKKTKAAKKATAAKKAAPARRKDALSPTQAKGERVRAAKRRTERLLGALEILLSSGPEEGHRLIPVLLPLLGDLCRKDLVDAAAQRALEALVSTSDICALLPHLAPGMTACLRLGFRAARAGDGKLLEGTLKKIAALCVDEDPSGVLDFSFSVPTFLLLQPLLLAALRSPEAPMSRKAEKRRRLFFSKGLVPLLRCHATVHEDLKGGDDIASIRATAPASLAGREDLRATCRAKNVLLALRSVQLGHEMGVLEMLEGREDPCELLLEACGQSHPLSLGELDILFGPEGMFHPAAPVRTAAAATHPMVSLPASPELPSTPADEEQLYDLRCRLFASCHDPDSHAAVLSRETWETLGLVKAQGEGCGLALGFERPLLRLFASNPENHVRDAVAAAMAEGLQSIVSKEEIAAEMLLGAVFALFRDHPPPKERDPNAEVSMEELFGSPSMSREEAKKDSGKPFRACAAATLAAFGDESAFSAEDGESVGATEALLVKTVDFIIVEGLVERDDDVRWLMLRAGAALARGYGPSHALQILGRVEKHLDGLLGRAAADRDEDVADSQREGCVILLGTAANFLDAGTEAGKARIEGMMDVLGATLATPSAAVQSSTAEVMVPLVPKCQETASQLLDTLLSTCLAVDAADREKSKTAGRMSYGQRRGAAVGAAALIRGAGIDAMKGHTVKMKLEEAAKGGMGAKEGALLCVAALSEQLGILFEPFLIDILPLLLRLFSDGSDRVRESADAAARNIMSQLTSYGVKLLLPAALRALREPAWRVKQAAIGVLGAMSSCSPKQLSKFLPDIIPPLASTVGDAHQKVRAAGSKALQDMGEVMKNPEVRALSTVIFAALGNPTQATGPALVSLLACEFKHAVDAASLAFCIPLLLRGLKTRGAEQKRHAASITGNLVAVLADPRDMMPYLDPLLDGLKVVLHDAMPDVRAVAARSMGAMIRGLGEPSIPALVPWLLVTTRGGQSGAARAGSAEGLSETLLVLGTQRCNVVLEEMLADARSSEESVREGVLWLLCFLPPGLGSEFSVRLGVAVPVLLEGLTDESDGVRDVARKAGQVLVGSHGVKFCSLMMPPIQDALLADHWRMRQASLQFLGDLLCKIGGIRAVGLADAVGPEGGAGEAAGVNTTADTANAAILDVLGRAERNKVLALLYMLRHDIEGVVRQMAVTLWKTIVPNLGRALREITGELVQHIVSSLSSTSFDRRLLAGRSLGELVKKLGDTVLPDVLPFLQAGLKAEDEGRRQGVCMGLAQVFEHASAEQVSEYTSMLVPAVCGALCDRSPRVRDAAAQAFGTLHRSVGAAALDAVIPSLVSSLGDADAEEGNAAMDGLQSIIRLQPTDLLAHLLPQWTTRPPTAVHLRAISAACRAAGDQIHFHLRMLVPFFADALATEDAALVSATEGAAQALAASAEDVAMQWMAQELCTPLDNEEDAAQRAAGATLVRIFFTCSGANYNEQLPIYLKHLMPLLLDTDANALKSAHAAFTALVGAVDESVLASQVQFFRNTLGSEVSTAKMRPGGVGTDGEFFFPATNDIPKGLAPFLPMYVTALKSGYTPERESAALGIAELVSMTSETALKPFVAKLLGPLIRIGGSRLAAEVKRAIIAAQMGVLERGGATVKTFAPQLQNLFTRATLDETSTAVRVIGAQALQKLMRISTRVPQVLQELGSAAGDAETLPPVRASALQAIRGILRVAGDKVGVAYLDNLSERLLSCLHAGDDVVRLAAARALAPLGTLLDAPTLGGILQTTLLVREAGREGDALGLAAVMKYAFPEVLAALQEVGVTGPAEALMDVVASDLAAKHWILKYAGCRGWAALTAAAARVGDTDILDMVFARKDASESLQEALRAKADPDLRVEGLNAVKQVAKALSQPQRRELGFFVGAVYEAARGTQTRTRGPAERAMVALVGSGAPVALDLGQVATREGWMEEGAAGEMADHARRIYGRMPAESDDEAED